jgi:hypothetical protein
MHRRFGYVRGVQTLRASSRARVARSTVVACALVALATGCTSASAIPSTTVTTSGDVMLLGDSLADQAAPYLATLLPGRQMIAAYFGGTAPCDWLLKHPPIAAGSTVVISFSGNSLTPCMADGAGGHLAGKAVVNRYRADVGTLVSQALAEHAHVILVGQPVHIDLTGDNDNVQALNVMYTEMAARPGVAYVDAGAAVENADGSFAHTLPCLTGEPSCGPSGSNVVRNDDGVHFCPGASVPGACTEYSSGAFRFADAMAKAIGGG